MPPAAPEAPGGDAGAMPAPSGSRCEASAWSEHARAHEALALVLQQLPLGALWQAAGVCRAWRAAAAAPAFWAEPRLGEVRALSDESLKALCVRCGPVLHMLRLDTLRPSRQRVTAAGVVAALRAGACSGVRQLHMPRAVPGLDALECWVLSDEQATQLAMACPALEHAACMVSWGYEFTGAFQEGFCARDVALALPGPLDFIVREQQPAALDALYWHKNTFVSLQFRNCSFSERLKNVLAEHLGENASITCATGSAAATPRTVRADRLARAVERGRCFAARPKGRTTNMCVVPLPRGYRRVAVQMRQRCQARDQHGAVCLVATPRAAWEAAFPTARRRRRCRSARMALARACASAVLLSFLLCVLVCIVLRRVLVLLGFAVVLAALLHRRALAVVLMQGAAAAARRISSWHRAQAGGGVPFARGVAAHEAPGRAQPLPVLVNTHEIAVGVAAFAEHVAVVIRRVRKVVRHPAGVRDGVFRVI